MHTERHGTGHGLTILSLTPLSTPNGGLREWERGKWAGAALTQGRESSPAIAKPQRKRVRKANLQWR